MDFSFSKSGLNEGWRWPWGKVTMKAEQNPVPHLEVNAARLSEELRLGSGGCLTERRVIAGLSLIAIGAMGIISLYQMGIMHHLPEPPLPHSDSDRLGASAEAYSHFETPDAVLGIGNYAATLGLAAMGGMERAKTRRWIPLALAAKTGVDAFLGVKSIIDQTVRKKAYCFWCLIAATASVGLLPFALPEAWVALRGKSRVGAERNRVSSPAEQVTS